MSRLPGRRRNTACGGHLLHGFHDRGIHHHGRNGGAGDAIDGHIAIAFRAAQFDLLVNRDPAVLLNIVLEVLIGDTHDQDGLGMLRDFETGDLPLQIKANQQRDRLAGIGRDRRNIGGAHQVTQQHLVPIHRRGQRLTFKLADKRRSREVLLCQRIHGSGNGRLAHARQTQQAGTQPDIQVESVT